MANLFVSYDLRNPGQNYEAVARAVKGLGVSTKIQMSHWYVSSTLTAEVAAQRVWNAMDSNDTLIVVDATRNTAYWYGLPTDASAVMSQHWNRQAA